MSKRSVTIPD